MTHTSISSLSSVVSPGVNAYSSNQKRNGKLEFACIQQYGFTRGESFLTQCKDWGLQIVMTCACCSTCCELTVANRSVSAGRSSAGATSCMQRHAVAFLILTARAAAAAVGDESSSVCYILHIEANQPGQAGH